MMTVLMLNVVETDPHNQGEVFHLSIQHEGRGSPVDKEYDGGIFKMDGMPRERTIRLLRRFADHLESGMNISQIALP